MLPSPSLSSCISFFKSFFISNHLKFGSHFTSWHSSSSYSLAKICISFYSTNGFKKLTLLLPSYYCGQSLRFVRSLPFVELFFYPITSCFAPDHSFIANNFSGARNSIFIHVHYFGSYIDPSSSLEFCRLHNAVLIEDCTHLASPFLDFEFYGDYLLFSPYKFFPLPPIALTLSAAPLDSDSLSIFPISLFWLFKRLIRLFLPSAIRSSPPTLNSVDFYSFDSYIHPCAVQHTSLLLSSPNKIISIRQFNHDSLARILSQKSGWTLAPLLDILSPFLLTYICDSAEISERRFSIVNSGMKVALRWPDLPSEVLKSPEQFHSSIQASELAIHFIVHQSLNIDSLIKYLEPIVCSPDF